MHEEWFVLIRLSWYRDHRGFFGRRDRHRKYFDALGRRMDLARQHRPIRLCADATDHTARYRRRRIDFECLDGADAADDQTTRRVREGSNVFCELELSLVGLTRIADPFEVDPA